MASIKSYKTPRRFSVSEFYQLTVQGVETRTSSRTGKDYDVVIYTDGTKQITGFATLHVPLLRAFNVDEGDDVLMVCVRSTGNPDLIPIGAATSELREIHLG